jgi:tetratricopeptide (TPR) repeat protein
MRALWVVMLLATAAAADGTTLEGLVRQAETAEKTARESRDLEAYEVCGAAYAEAANAAATQMSDLVPEMTYNAAVCYEMGASTSAATVMYSKLIDEHRSSKLVPRALARRGQIYMSIAYFDQAAADFELYAQRYAGEKDAADALENAFRLRVALGDDRGARKDAETWIKFFGAKRPADAADVAFVLAWRTRDAGKADEALDAYRTWLRTYSGKARREQIAAAYLAIGELRWQASCKGRPTAEGLCVARTRTTATATATARCGTHLPVVAVARDPALVKEATAALQKAVSVATTSGDELAMLRGDQARLLLADQRLEAALAIETPIPVVDAAGAPTAASTKELMTWLGTWQRVLTEARRGYEDLLRSKNARVSVAAAGRIALLVQHAADTLGSAPLPKMKKTRLDVIRGLYCDALEAYVAPLDAQAEQAAAACLDVAGRTGVVEETAGCAAIWDRHHPEAAAAGERLPAPRPPRVTDLEPPSPVRPSLP